MVKKSQDGDYNSVVEVLSFKICIALTLKTSCRCFKLNTLQKY